jgi:hypothetical protein
MRGEKGEPWTEVLSWEPRAFVYHNFLVSLSHHSFLFFAGKGHVLDVVLLHAYYGQEISSFCLSVCFCSVEIFADASIMRSTLA